MKKKIIYIVVGVLVVLASYFLFFAGNDGSGESYTVTRSSVTEEIFETGSVKKGDTFNLSFKEAGRVDSVLVSENELVQKGDVIARLENSSLLLQLEEAKEAKRTAEIALQRLLLGSRDEEVDIARAAVSSAEDSLLSAERSLRDTEKSVEESLSSAYKDVPSRVSSAYLRLKVTSEEAADFIDDYFGSFVTFEAAKARRGRDKIYNALLDVQKYSSVAREDLSFEEKDEALREMRSSLRLALEGVEDIIDAAQSDTHDLSSDVVDIMRARETQTITDMDTITSLAQSVSSVRAETDASLNNARSAVSSAENAVERAQRDLDRVTASPLEEEVRERESAVRRAEASVSLVEERIKDTVLRAPSAGRVAQIHGKAGELVSLGTPFVTLVSDDRFYVEADIYEGDIVKMNIGNPVEVELVAFPGEVYNGEVSFINETGRVINNVVYYKIEVEVDDLPERTMAEMSCDLTIITAKKEGALTVPDRFLERRDGKRIAKVRENGEVVEKEVEVGVRATGGVMEVLSGLNEGDVVYE